MASQKLFRRRSADLAAQLKFGGIALLAIVFGAVNTARSDGAGETTAWIAVGVAGAVGLLAVLAWHRMSAQAEADIDASRAE